ncbi:hypothetical protein [Niveispirillum cyanobacteriorum]|uniref:Uncharacterized protein n=1 Tax=Niveispirillum cyanobacteriorum TaxID=1612173 RepID=A0A2K9NFU4_9PROT|nr:hypothetical protein [Niveispirillum cyanobacteriorum]AUN31937.1 hypothetical protein C0V82_16020 [Niveispirillum cyanobacteriorum]GGE85618.1 hypothetical protein GCM10011317_48520 [Niveispirillum cyanobacteriorum]
MAWLFRGQPYSAAAGAVVSLYLSDVGFITEPADSPANTYWDRRLRVALSLERSLFARGNVGGRSEMSAGVTVAENLDGALDGWSNYDWDGRRIDIWYSAKEKPVWADFSLVWSGTAERFTPGTDEVRIDLRDLQLLLERPYQVNRFAGTGGAEGFAELAGRRKPRAMGRPKQISPIQICKSPVVYAYGDGPCGGVLAAHDRGDLFTAVGGDYSTYAAMAAASMAGVDYVTCNALGLIRFASQPVGPVTLDVEGRTLSGSAAVTFANMLSVILPIDTSLTSGDFATGTVAAMNSLCPQVLGHWYDGGSEVLVADIVDEWAESIGVYWGFDLNRKLVLGRFDAPKPTADFSFVQRGILSIDPTATERRLATQTIGYGRRWRTLSDAEIAGSIVTGRDALGQEWQAATYTDGTVATQSLLARTERVDTCLMSQSAAAAEALRRVGLHGPRREGFELRVPFTPGLDAGATVSVTHDRHGLSGGKRFVVMAADRDAAAEEHLLTLWG